LQASEAAAGNYAAGTQTASFTVAQAIPVITWAAPAPINAGTALSATQLDATASVPGTFVYTPAAGTVLNTVGAQTLNVVFTPTDATDYATATASVPLTVNAAPSYTVTASPTSLTLAGGSGSTALSTLTATATSTYTGTVTFTCATAPATTSFTCAVSPSSLSFAAGIPTPQTATLTLTNAAGVGMANPETLFQSTSRTLYTAMALASLLGLFGLRRKGTSKHLRNLMMLVLLCAGFAGAASMMGCSGGGFAGGTNYTVTVTATDQTTTVNIPFKVTVQ
jgi:hypothetical protein